MRFLQSLDASDAPGICVPSGLGFSGIFTALSKRDRYTETETGFPPLSVHEGCSAVTSVMHKSDVYVSPLGFLAEVERAGDFAIIHCSGRLCFHGEAKLLADTANALLKSGTDIVLDFQKLELLDSAGIGELVLISMQSKALGRNVLVARAPKRIHSLLQLTNVASLFDFFESTEAALEHCLATAV